MVTIDGRRTRLSPDRQSELYEAVIELLREVGYEGMSMQMIATRARCGKATLYRLWPGKPGLVVAAVRYHQAPVENADNIDTGSLKTDLHEMARRLARVAPADAELMTGLAHTALRNPELARAMRDQNAAAVLNRILAHATKRGEVPADAPSHAFAEHILLGVLLARPLIDGIASDEAFLLRFVDAVLLPLLLPANPAPPNTSD